MAAAMALLKNRFSTRTFAAFVFCCFSFVSEPTHLAGHTPCDLQKHFKRNVEVGESNLEKTELLEEFVHDVGFLAPIRNFLDK
jgi:hypothetical protein